MIYTVGIYGIYDILYRIRINKQLFNTYINLNIQYITMNYIYNTYIVGYLLNLPDNVFI